MYSADIEQAIFSPLSGVSSHYERSAPAYYVMKALETYSLPFAPS